MYYKKENGKIVRSSAIEFNGALYTDELILEGFDHSFYLESDMKTEEYLTRKKEHENNSEKKILIEKKKSRLEELRKDMVQSIAGLKIDDIEDRKEEYRTLLNEVRVLQGKEPRKTQGEQNAVKTELEQESVQTESQDGVEIREE